MEFHRKLFHKLNLHFFYYTGPNNKIAETSLNSKITDRGCLSEVEEAIIIIGRIIHC